VEYWDKLAEAAVKEAIVSVAKDGKRAHSQSVPPVARRLLAQKGRSRLAAAEIDKRVQQAIVRLKERREIKAPQTPNNDWAVIGHQEPAPADAKS
jgi:hypothetical protein